MAFKDGSKGKEDTKEKGKVEVTSSKIRDIKCYNCKRYGHYATSCPSKKTIMCRANGEVSFEDEEERDKEVYEDRDESPYDGEALVIFRAVNSQVF